MKKNQQWRMSAALSLAVHPVSAAVALSLLPAVSALAADMDEVVVSATRYEQKLSDALADITVVDSEEIERSGSNSLAELLARQPGIQMTTTGGAATTTEVFVRGAPSQYTAVYLDGVRLDSQTTSGGVTWANIPLNLIDRIEILRGPAAAVYGSDAVSGVILLFTKKGEGKAQPFMSVGYGSKNTFRADAGISGAQGNWDYSLSALREGTHGKNVKPDPAAKSDPDDDGFYRTSFMANAGLKINARNQLQAQIVQTKTLSDYDDSTNINHAQYDREMLSVGASWIANWSPIYRSTVSASSSVDEYSMTHDRSTNSKTRLNNYLWSNEFKINKVNKLTVAVERREDYLENSGVQNGDLQKRHQNALALGYGWTNGNHSFQVNARHDEDSSVGGKSTGGLAYGWKFAPQWVINASAATSFRVPTLYQRFAYENDQLKPEEGKNIEFGLKWAQGTDNFSVTAYRNRLKNMVVYQSKNSAPCNGSPTACYANVDLAVLEGITFGGAYRTGMLSWYGSLDFQNPRNLSANTPKNPNIHGKLLKRRAQRFATLGVTSEVHGWTLGAEMQATSHRYDDADNSQAKRMHGYALFNLSVSKEVAKDTKLITRLDNAFDRSYEVAQGYATPGRGVWVGLKWTPQ